MRMKRWLSAVGCLMFLTLAVTPMSGTAAAQESDEQYDLGISAVNCDNQAPKNITVQQEGCRPAEGVVFTVTVQGGEPIGSCTAASADVANPITAGCSISIPYGATVVVNEDPASLPAGYQPIENAQVFTAPDASPDGPTGGVLFVNLLVDDTAALVEALVETLIDILREVLG